MMRPLFFVIDRVQQFTYLLNICIALRKVFRITQSMMTFHEKKGPVGLKRPYLFNFQEHCLVRFVLRMLTQNTLINDEVCKITGEAKTFRIYHRGM